MVEAVADAIDAAQCPGRQGPYGFFDYTSYGADEPFQVRDFRDPQSATWGDCVFASSYRETARAEYDRLTRAHVASAAIAIVIDEAVKVAESYADYSERNRGISPETQAPIIRDAIRALTPKAHEAAEASNARDQIAPHKT